MSEPVKVQFYTVTKCGYYNEDGAHQFCTFGEMLAQVHSWATRPGRTLRHLKTFEMSDPPTVYLVNAAHHEATGDYLLTTWNQVPSMGSAMPSLRADNSFGNAVVDSTSHPINNVPGYPSYFWMLPDHGAFATIKTDSETPLYNGHRGLCKFFSAFLTRYSEHCVYGQQQHDMPAGTNSTQVVGYRRNADVEQEPCDIEFESRIARRSGPLDQIREQRPHIRKLIYRHTLRTTEKESHRTFQRFLMLMSGEKPGVIEQTARFKAEMSYCPTEQQLERIISRWQESGGDNWDNVGFKFKKKKPTVWLNNLLVKMDPMLDVERANGLLAGNHLLNQLVSQRQVLVAQFGEAHNG